MTDTWKSTAPDGKCCGGCKWYDGGLCHRLPPQAIMWGTDNQHPIMYVNGFSFPDVRKEDWCGEWANAEGRASLDKAWHIIAAQGGYVAPHDVAGNAYAEAIGEALAIIESLGGMDPLVRGRER